MFYCDLCARRAGWPETLSRSFGRCEECGAQADCNDRPARELPRRRRDA